jgi:hypothetical protein
MPAQSTSSRSTNRPGYALAQAMDAEAARALSDAAEVKQEEKDTRLNMQLSAITRAVRNGRV